MSYTSFIGYDYNGSLDYEVHPTSLRPREPDECVSELYVPHTVGLVTSLEVESLMADMAKVADACVWDAHASAQYSISSMHKDYRKSPKPGEPPFAFSLPDNELREQVEAKGLQPGELNLVMGGDGEPKMKGKLWDLAQRIVKLKRAGRDAEAIELLKGNGGRIIEGFYEQEDNEWARQAARRGSK